MHRGEIADAAQQTHRDPRRAARPPRDLGGALGTQVEIEDAGAARHDQRQLVRLVEDQAQRDAEALAQRPGDQARAGRRADQGEGLQVDPDRARGRALADDQVELKILHRRIEDLLDRRRQAVDLVDEQDVARLQVGQQRREVAGALDHRARGGAEADPELAGDDLRQRRLAEARAARRTARGRAPRAGFSRPR